MKPSFRTHADRMVLSFLFGVGIAFSAAASLETAGEMLVNFDAATLTPGETVPSLDAVRSFTATGSPTVGSYTTNGVTVTALTFDGVDDTLVSSAIGTGTGTNQALTVEAWLLNPSADSSDGSESIFSWAPATSGSALGGAFVYNAAGQAALFGTERVLFHNDFCPEPNQWHHIAVTYTGGSPATWETGIALVYVDGVLNRWFPAPQTSGQFYSWPDNGQYVLGARMTSTGTAAGLFSGALAKLRFHSGALTPAQIRANYMEERGSFPSYVTGPAALENPGEVVLDLDASGLATGALAAWAGNSTQTLTQAVSASRPTVGTVGGVKAVTFDGGDWLEVANVDARLTGSASTFTIETYIYNPGIDNEESYFCWAPRGNSGVTWDGKCRAVAYGSNAGYGAVGCWKPAWEVGFASLPAAGAWHHIVTTYDGATMRVYVDGFLDAAKTMTLNQTTGLVYSIGRASSQDGISIKYFSGSIARLRVCTGALVPSQVYKDHLYLNSVLTGSGTPVLAAYGGSGSYSSLSDLGGSGDYRETAVQLGGSASMTLSENATVARLGLTDGASLSLGSGKTLTVTDRTLVGGGSTNPATSTLTVAGTIRSTASAARAARYALAVGLDGRGEMTIASGAAVTLVNATEFWVGSGNNATGKLTVNGALTNNNWFLLGRFGGAGDMRIDGGKVACNGILSMGDQSDSASLRMTNGAACNATTVHAGKWGGSATVDAAGGSTLTAGTILLNTLTAGSCDWGSAAIRMAGSTLAVGSGGVTTKGTYNDGLKDNWMAPYLPVELALSNSTLLATANLKVTVPCGLLGTDTLATAGKTVSLRDTVYGDSFATSGGGALDMTPKSALDGTVTVNGGALTVEAPPYRWCANNLALTNGSTVTSWEEDNYEAGATRISGGPFVVTNAINGKKALRFNTDALRQLQVNARLNPLAGAESATIAVVFKPYANGFNSGSLASWWNSSLFIGGELSKSANDWGFVFSQDGRIGLALCQVSAGGAVDLVQYHAATVTLNAPHVALCAWQPGKIALNLDGDETLNPAVYLTKGANESNGSLPGTLEGVTLPRATSTLFMGDGSGNQSHCFNGEIAEIRVYKNRCLDRYARQRLVRDLATEYGLTAAAAAAAAALTNATYAADLAALDVSTNAAVPAAAAVWAADTLTQGDAETVSIWPDAVSARAASGSAIYVANGIGGQPALRFSGSPMTVASGDNPVVGAQQFTAAIVFQADDSYASSAVNWWNGGGLLGDKLSATVNNNDWGLALVNGRIVAGAGAQVTQSYNYLANFTVSMVAKSKPKLSDGNPHVVVYRWSNNGVHAVSVDGIAVNLNSVGYARTAQALFIGGTMSGNGFSGLISEVRFYGARLTDAQEAAVGQELAGKYGVYPSAYGTPKALPGQTLTLNSAVLNISTSYCDSAVSTIQSNQTVIAAGTSSINGVLCVGAGATLSLPSVTDTLTLGDLALQNGSTLKWRHESKSSTPIHVTGDLALPSRFTLDLTGSGGIPATQMTLIEYDGSATLPSGGTTATVVGAFKAGTKVVVVSAEKRVVVLTPAGTMVLIR